MARVCWAILTGEYPPQSGGVSDYTRLLSRALAAGGDQVHIFAPVCRCDQISDTDGLPDLAAGLAPRVQEAGLRPHCRTRGASPAAIWANAEHDPSVIVHRLEGGFDPRGLGQLSRQLTVLGPDRLLVQYVPDAFGMRAVNLPFCLWLLICARQPVWTMFHEVAYPWRRDRWKLNGLALLTRCMAAILLAASQRVFVSIPAWRRMLKPLNLLRRKTDWLPVVSNLPAQVDAGEVAALRKPLAGRSLLGHFSTLIEPIANLLRKVLPDILRGDARRIVWVIGRGSEEFKNDLVRRNPDLGQQIQATGPLAPAAAALRIAACDLLLQPYPDGLSTRRSSLMAALALGTPVLTQVGSASEDFWQTSGAVALAPNLQQIVPLTADLLADPERRRALATRGKAFYAEHFGIEKTVAILRAAPEGRA